MVAPRRPTSSARSSQPPRRRVAVLRFGATFAVLAVMSLSALAATPTYALFRGTSTNTGTTFGSAATFPTYSASVTGDSAWAYHRAEESPSASATFTAADTSGNARTGAYNGITNGPTTFWKLDENTGSTATDASGGANPGTMVNSPTWTTGKVGYAASFNGTSQYVNGARAAVNTSTSFTVAAWVYLTAKTSQRTVIAQDGTVISGFFLQYDLSSDQWTFARRPTDANPAGTVVQAKSLATVTLNTWYHLTGVYDSVAQTIKLYVNGALQNTTAFTSPWIATGVLTVGRSKWNSSNADYFPGYIDEVRTYQRALTAGEVLSLGSGLPVVDWQYSEGSGTAVADRGTSGYAGQLVNGPAYTASGHDGNGIVFDGTNDSVTGVSGAAIATNTSFSVSSWVYLTAKTTNRTAVAQNATNISGFYLQYDFTADRWAFTIRNSDSTGAGFSQALSAASPTLNTWYHLTGVYNGTNVKLYVNGALQNTTAFASPWNATGVLTVGKGMWAGASADFWPGTIDTVKVWQRALSATEISQVLPLTDLEFSEGTGGTTADQGSNAAVGTLTNTVWNTTTGRDGNAVDFASVSSARVTIPAALNTSTPYTVSAWARLNSKAGSNDRVVLCQNGATACAFSLRFSDAWDRWMFEASPSEGGSSVQAVGLLSPALSTWYHLVGVYNGTNIKLYVDGALQNTTTTVSVWNATTTFAIGRSGTGGSPIDFFDGTIDSVKAWQVALSDVEITDMYNGRAYTGGYTEADMTAGLTGALQGAQQGQTATTAVAFAGRGNAYNSTSMNNPTTFTIECWFRGASGAGGQLIGFANTTAGPAASLDRMIYLDSGGKITFAVYPSAFKTVRSTSTYDDGAWHHVAASLGGAGMKLYVDGALVASDAATTTAQNFTGYWRWGGGTLSFWANRPTNDYFTGAIDEVAVYTTQLTDNKVARHYAANH